MSIYVDDMTRLEFAEWAREGIAILPIGATEQHGSHLPLSTDSIQPEHVARAVAERTGAKLLPPIRYGLCQGTRDFPGTITISFDTLRAIVRDILCELARHGVKRAVVLSGHAGSGHMAALKRAAQDIVDAYEMRVLVLSDYDIAYQWKGGEGVPKDDGHAGTIETSRVLDIRPDLVKELPEAFYPEYPRFEVVRDLSPYWPPGIHGDPQAANAGLGKEVNDYIVEELCKLVEGLKG